MRGNLKWAWAMTALYAIAGSYGLACLALVMFHVDAPFLYMLAIPAACFLGVGLTQHFSGGRSHCEGVLAAIFIGLAQLLFCSWRGGGEPLGFSHSASLGVAFLCLAGAVAARRPAAKLIAADLPHLANWLRSGLAALVLFGAYALHGLFVFGVAGYSGRLAGLVGLATLFATPTLAGMALQRRHRGEVETLLVNGLGLLGVVLSVMIGFGDLGRGLVFSVIFVVPAMALYTMALPGIIFTRTSRSWPPSCNELPRAIVIPGRN